MAQKLAFTISIGLLCILALDSEKILQNSL